MSRSGVQFPAAAPSLTSGYATGGAAEQVRIMLVWSQYGRSMRQTLVGELCGSGVQNGPKGIRSRQRPFLCLKARAAG